MIPTDELPSDISELCGGYTALPKSIPLEHFAHEELSKVYIRSKPTPPVHMRLEDWQELNYDITNIKWNRNRPTELPQVRPQLRKVKCKGPCGQVLELYGNICMECELWQRVAQEKTCVVCDAKYFFPRFRSSYIGSTKFNDSSVCSPMCLKKHKKVLGVDHEVLHEKISGIYQTIMKCVKRYQVGDLPYSPGLTMQLQEMEKEIRRLIAEYNRVSRILNKPHLLKFTMPRI